MALLLGEGVDEDSGRKWSAIHKEATMQGRAVCPPPLEQRGGDPHGEILEPGMVRCVPWDGGGGVEEH